MRTEYVFSKNKVVVKRHASKTEISEKSEDFITYQTLIRKSMRHDKASVQVYQKYIDKNGNSTHTNGRYQKYTKLMNASHSPDATKTKHTE